MDFSIKIPIDIVVLVGPNSLYFIYQMVFLSGDRRGGGSFFPATSERFDHGILFHPLCAFVAVLLWGLLLRFGVI